MTPASELYRVYEEYSRTLRTWLVAYGVGAPVLFLTNDSLAETFLKSGQARSIAICFIIGVSLQIVLAALNKNVMWACYCAEENPDFRNNPLCASAGWISRQYWIDLFVDIATIVLFAAATLKAFDIFVAK